MKVRFLALNLLFMAFLIGANCNAQENLEIDLTKLRAPSSPASQILGSQPSTITRPKSWNDLEASLLSNFLNDSGNFNLNNLVNLEFSPYWLKKDRKISTEDFLFQKNLLRNAAQNFTISISTTNNLILNDTVGEVNNTAIGLGFRSMLWNGSKIEREEIEKRYNDLRASLKSNTRMLLIINNVNCFDCSKKDFIDSLEVKLLSEFKNLPGNSDNEKFELIKNLKKELTLSLKNKSKDGIDYKDYIDSLLRKDVKYSRLSADLLSLQELLDNRKGFKLEIAGAIAIDFPDNKTNRSFVPQYGFWATPSYQPSKTNWIEFLGVLKYQGYELDFYRPFLSNNQIPKNSIDVGLKLVLKADKFSFEIETLNRWLDNEVLADDGSFENNRITDKKNVLRLSYRISNNLLLSYDFGENFEIPAINNNNLISIIGLNYGVGQAKKKNID